MHNKEIGYVAVQFTEETNQKIIEWSRTLKKEDLITANINGKIEGGIVVDKLHLTLFYGLNDEILDKDELSGFLNKIELKEIKVNGPGLFPIGEYNCESLHLSVRDDDDNLKKMHEELKKFPHFPEYQKFEYLPHITVAYVKKDFSLDVLSQDFPEVLYVHKVFYKKTEM